MDYSKCWPQGPNDQNMLTSDWEEFNKEMNVTVWRDNTKENNNFNKWNWRDSSTQYQQPKITMLNNNQYGQSQPLLAQPTWFNHNNFCQPRTPFSLNQPFNRHTQFQQPRYSHPQSPYKFPYSNHMNASMQNYNGTVCNMQSQQSKRKCNVLFIENEEIESEDEELPSHKRQRISLDDVEKLFATFSINDKESEQKTQIHNNIINTGEELDVNQNIFGEIKTNNMLDINKDSMLEVQNDKISDAKIESMLHVKNKSMFDVKNNTLVEVKTSHSDNTPDVKTGQNIMFGMKGNQNENCQDKIYPHSNIHNISSKNDEDIKTYEQPSLEPGEKNAEVAVKEVGIKRGVKRDVDIDENGDTSTSFTLRIKKYKPTVQVEEKVKEVENYAQENKIEKEVTENQISKKLDESKEREDESEDTTVHKEVNNNNEEEGTSLTTVGTKRDAEGEEEFDRPGNSNKRLKKIKRGLRLCSNITCYIEQILYNC